MFVLNHKKLGGILAVGRRCPALEPRSGLISLHFLLKVGLGLVVLTLKTVAWHSFHAGLRRVYLIGRNVRSALARYSSRVSKSQKSSYPTSREIICRTIILALIGRQHPQILCHQAPFDCRRNRKDAGRHQSTRHFYRDSCHANAMHRH